VFFFAFALSSRKGKKEKKMIKCVVGQTMIELVFLFIRQGKANKDRAYLALFFSNYMWQWQGRVPKDKTCLALVLFGFL
jgi:hypothetical protein